MEHASGGRWSLGVLAGLFLFFAVHNLVYLSLYGRPPHYDQAYQVTLSLDMADTLARRPAASFGDILDVSGFYPPLLYLYTAPLYALAGRSLYVARASELGFLFILLWSVYALGRRFGGEKTGLLAAALCGLYPIVFGISRLYTNDFPLLALVALALERLWAGDGFRRFGPSVHFGLACAAGMLVKWTFVCFLLPPLVYAVVWQAYGLAPERWALRALRDSSARWRLYLAFLVAWCALLYGVARALSADNGAGKWAWIATTAALALLISALAWRVREGFPCAAPAAPSADAEAAGINLLAAFLVALVPAFPWYFRHSDYVVKVAATVVEDMSALRGMPAITRPEAWGYYFNSLLSHQLHLIFFALALGACGWALWKGGAPRTLALLFLFQYLILSAIRHKDPRYFMPALPLLAVLTACWMLSCLPRRARAGVVVAVLVVGLLQMEAVTWGSPLLREINLGAVQVWKQHGYGSHECLGENWPLAQMVATARRHAPAATPDHPAVIALACNSDCLHYEALNVYAKLARLPVQAQFVGQLDARADQSLWQALAADFLLLKSGDPGPAYSLGTLPEVQTRLGADATPNLPMHDRLEQWTLPDGTEATLYQRRAAAGLPVRFGDLAILERVELLAPHPDQPRQRRLVAHWRQVDSPRLTGVLVFIHLLREDGGFVAPYSYPLLPSGGQADGEGGATANYELALPPDLPSGRYRLALGLWRPGVDGRRIPTSAGADVSTVVEGFDCP